MADDDNQEELPPIWETYLKDIYHGAITSGDIDAQTALAMADDLADAVFKGFGKTFAQVDYNTPDYIMLRNMERDVYKFSAAKSYQMNKTLTGLLKDGDRLRTYSEWRREAQKELIVWKDAWQQAEHQTALSTARNNADYIRFQANKDTMPLLRRSAIHDARECPICAIYDGLTAPINSPVWKWAYGDLHFRDRCRMLQLATGTATPEDKIPSQDAIPKAFRVNLADKMLAFPPGHPYYEGVPAKKLNKFVNQNAPDREQ